MSRPDSHPDDAGTQLPQGLLQDLQAVYGRDVHVPASTDQKILSMARARLLKPEVHGWRRMAAAWKGPVRWAAVFAMAALVMLAIRLALWDRPVNQEQDGGLLATGTPASAGEDLNSDGRVNILDAYLLARRVKLAEKLQKEWDFNADGRVDEADARFVARAAVKMEGGSLQ